MVAFQLGWIGVYALGAGAGLVAADGERQCFDRNDVCPSVVDNKSEYTKSFVAGAGGLLAAGVLTGVAIHFAEDPSPSRSANRSTLSLVPGPNGAILMGRF